MLERPTDIGIILTNDTHDNEQYNGGKALATSSLYVWVMKQAIRPVQKSLMNVGKQKFLSLYKELLSKGKIRMML